MNSSLTPIKFKIKVNQNDWQKQLNAEVIKVL